MFVLTTDLGLREATARSAAPPAVLDAPAASRREWASAGLAAGTGLAAFALALAGRRRRRRFAAPGSDLRQRVA